MEKNRKKNRSGGKNFVVQGSILAAAGIVVRVIGMLYRIPLTNLIGEQGIGYYSSAYGIYSIMLIVSSYSMPVAVSKMIAVRLSRHEYRNSQRILRAALAYATLAGGAAAGIMWFGADVIAGWIARSYSRYALKALAPTIWIMAYLGVLRGYFQGHGTMIPTAFSQVAEQVINALVSIIAGMLLFNYGLKANLVHDATEYSYAYGATGGAIGTGAGALTAFLLFVLLLLIYRPVMRRQVRKDRSNNSESYGYITKIMFWTVVPIVMSSTIYNISAVLDDIMYGQLMGKIGLDEAEIATNWGVYSGQYHLLFNIPVGIANALSSSLIPALTMAVADGKRKPIREKIGTVIRFSMILAIPSAVGLTVLADPICNLLFGGKDNTMLIHLLRYGSGAVVVFSLSTVTNAVLQGLNHMRVPIINALISLFIHLGVLYIMIAVFHMGVSSVVYSNIIFALLICLLNAWSIRRIQGYRQEIKKTFLIPAVSAVIMGMLARGTFLLIYKVLEPFMRIRMRNFYAVAAAILAAVMVYGACLLKLGGLSETELKGMPLGRLLVRIGAKMHLL